MQPIAAANCKSFVHLLLLHPTGFVAGYTRGPEGQMTAFVLAVSIGVTAVWAFGLAFDGTPLGGLNDSELWAKCNEGVIVGRS